MAIPTNIKTLLSGEVVEWARIEFKGKPSIASTPVKKNPANSRAEDNSI